RHRSAVRAGRGYGDQVAWDNVTRQKLVPHQDVATFTVLANDSGQGRWRGRPAGGQRRRVLRGVEGGANVVAHSPVDRNVEPARSPVQVDALDSAHPVESKG